MSVIDIVFGGAASMLTAGALLAFADWLLRMWARVMARPEDIEEVQEP